MNKQKEPHIIAVLFFVSESVKNLVRELEPSWLLYFLN